MDSRTKGAWLVHHANKIESTTNTDFDNITFAGKSAVLLSALSVGAQEVISQEKLRSLAKANGIAPKTELPSILDELKNQRLIEVNEHGIEVLGVAASSVVEHAARIFDESSPESHEVAALGAADLLSSKPLREREVLEVIGDEFHITRAAATDFLKTSSHIGLFDSEDLGGDKLYFNGNLFRRDGLKKTAAVLSSLGAEEEEKLTQLQAHLTNHGCIALDGAIAVCGEVLFRKIQSIGLVDVSSVGNDSGQHFFVTSPTSFSKFSNSLADDALDLAKALVAALTYGMTKSAAGRGRISMLSALMNRLLQGRFVGPATAIGQDYKVLEFKRVIEVRPEKDGRYSMRLLKLDVGRLALAVLQEGGVMPEQVSQFHSADVSKFVGPEVNRTEVRRRDAAPRLKSGVASILDDLRTGGY